VLDQTARLPEALRTDGPARCAGPAGATAWPPPVLVSRAHAAVAFEPRHEPKPGSGQRTV